MSGQGGACIGGLRNIASLLQIFERGPGGTKKENSMCPPKVLPPIRRNVDLVFTDILGVKDLKAVMKADFRTSYACKLRILDSFGTQAEFNHEKWVLKSKENKKL